ncbi:hypothetical protein BKA70DRAFT_1354880 [Coprinopsis sp. MPI-PUGE-AT-0042]|nr:hypothetical protein BKA70DRAFT_1354880 [Coprinopsis sp. MPI-PUGE-AT-0042]
MEGAGLEAGTYTLVNVRLPQWVIDTKDGLAVAYPFIGSPSQQWDVRTPDGVSWHIRNVASGRYLGLALGERVRNCLHLREVDHQFAWHLQHYQDRQHQFVPYVPYTRHVLDLAFLNVQPGRTILYVHEDNQGAHQAWQFYKDLHLEAPSTLTDGRTYKILNAQSHTAITAKDDRSVACFQSDNREGQMFQAVKTPGGWAFRNIQTETYLGIPHTIVYPDDNPRLSSVDIEFTWMVLPHHEGGGEFKIWLPFTQKVLDLRGGSREDDAPIHITGATTVEHIRWRFQEVPTPQQRQANIGLSTGERGAEEQ